MCEKLNKSVKVKGKWHYHFSCSNCGNLFEARGDYKPKSCGCLQNPIQQAPEHSYWKILEPVKDYKTKVRVLCTCCGNEYTRYPQKIVNGENISCSLCKGIIRMREEFKSFGGKRNHPLYTVWDAMKQRCYNPNSAEYNNYGARGVYVCEEWLNDSEAFILWAMQNGWQEGLYIDKDKLSMEQGLEVPFYSPSTVCFLSPDISALFTRLSRANTSGARGVSFRKSENKYETYFNYKGKRYRPGLYSTIEEAVESLITMQKEILENE